MIEQLESPDVTILAFRLTGKLHDEDYQTFVPAVDQAIRDHGRIRLIVEMADFHGWDMKALMEYVGWKDMKSLWDDTKFATTHCTEIEKVAVLGDKAWEKGMAAICKPFTMAQVKYFDLADKQAAWEWIVD